MHAYIMHVVCGPGHPELLKSCMDMAIKLLPFPFTLQLLSHFRVKEDILAAQFQGVAGIVRSSPCNTAASQPQTCSTVQHSTATHEKAVQYICRVLQLSCIVFCFHCLLYRSLCLSLGVAGPILPSACNTYYSVQFSTVPSISREQSIEVMAAFQGSRA